MSWTIAIWTAGVLLFPVAAVRGDTWTEVGDAGEMPGTAQWPTGAGALALISGWVEQANDADMFAIYISNPATFSANTLGSIVFDTQLFLFDANGFGIAANDDIQNDGNGYNPRSALPAGSMPGLTAPGLYYLAVSSWNYDPLSAGGLIFNDNNAYAAISGATGPGGAAAISGWVGPGGLNGEIGAYQISLAGAEFAPTLPEPGTALMILGGVVGLCCGGAGRRVRVG